MNYKAYEMFQLSRFQIGQRIRGEKLRSFADKHGIDGMIKTELEHDFNFLNDINPELEDCWYDGLRGNELNKLFGD